MAVTLEEFNKLKAQLEELVIENAKLKERNLAAAKKEWKQFKDTILEVVADGDLFEGDFENFRKQVEDTTLFTKLIDANNPLSEVLGFTFLEVVERLAKQNFLNALPVEDRPRFEMEIIKSTIQNPVWQVLLQSNPVTFLVANVVDKISGFIKKIKIKRDKIIDIESAYDKAKIKNFITDLQPYIQFYDALSRATREYDAAVNELINRKGELKVRMNNYHGNFLNKLGVNATSGAALINQVTEKITPASQEEESYLALLEDENLINAHNIAKNFPLLKSSVRQFKLEYNKIFHKYLTGNLNALEAAKMFKSNNTELKDLIETIEKKQKELAEEIDDAVV